MATLVTAVHVAGSQKLTGHFASLVLALSSSASQSGWEVVPGDGDAAAQQAHCKQILGS